MTPRGFLEAVDGFFRILLEAFQCLPFEVVLGTAALAGAKRVVAEESNLHSGFAHSGPFPELDRERRGKRYRVFPGGIEVGDRPPPPRVSNQYQIKAPLESCDSLGYKNT